MALLAMSPCLAHGQTATLVAPADGSIDADLTRPIEWTAVPYAQAYYLYVGSAPGAKDIVNSGEVHGTTYRAAGSIPLGQRLYARLWTKAADIWRYSDTTFTAATQPQLAAVITDPPDNAAEFDLAKPIRWTIVPGAQAYYLYVGTSPGAKEII
jgi:hypothetical protein